MLDKVPSSLCEISKLQLHQEIQLNRQEIYVFILQNDST